MGYGVAVRQLLQDAIDELKPDPARAFSLQIIRGQSVRFESGQAAGSSILNLLPTDKALAGADPDSTHKIGPFYQPISPFCQPEAATRRGIFYSLEGQPPLCYRSIEPGN